MLYFFGLNQKYNYLYLIPSGIFLSLAGFARETFLLFIPFLFIHLWQKSSKRHLYLVFAPFIILFSFFWLPSALGPEGNAYLTHLTTQVSEKIKSADFDRYAHLFPDPYTFHFNQEEFLKDYQNQLVSKETDFFTKTNLIKSASNIGIRKVELLERIKVGSVLFINHLARFFSLEETGGPFIFLLMILGIYSLKQKDEYLYAFSLGWIFTLFFLLSFVVLAGRLHLMDFNWILALLIVLGIMLLTKIIGGYFHFNQLKSAILLIILVLMVLYSQLLANHVGWNTIFNQDQKKSLRIKAYSQRIEELNISDQDVIAVPGNDELYRLNYLNNKSLVVFHAQTIQDLLNEEKLAFAFEKFKVEYIVGYSEEISKKIIDKTKVTNIASNSLALPEIKISPTISWLMNIIR